MIPSHLISLHFPKAGGTSLATQLQKLLPNQVAVDYDHDPLTEAGGETAPFPEGKRVVHGHFKPQRYACENAWLITFLREPVENLLSIYFYWRNLPEHGNPFSTLMSKVYFGDFDMNRFEFIGFHENRKHDIYLLSQMTSLPLRDDVHENPAPSNVERDELRANSAIMSSLRNILSEDVKFYEQLRKARSTRN